MTPGRLKEMGGKGMSVVVLNLGRMQGSKIFGPFKTWIDAVSHATKLNASYGPGQAEAILLEEPEQLP